MDLAEQIHSVTGNFPKTELFDLTSQMRRSAGSVPANLAEGSGRITIKEKIRFISISYSSLMELLCHCILAKRKKLITEEELVTIREQIDAVALPIARLRASFQKQLPSDPKLMTSN